MSELRSMAEALRSETLAELPDARIEEDFAELHGAIEVFEAGRIHSMNDLRKVAAYWRERVETEQGLGTDERQRARRRLHASVSFLGMVRLDGELDPEHGESLLTALGAVLDSEARSGGEEERRTPAQRRADAL